MVHFLPLLLSPLGSAQDPTIDRLLDIGKNHSEVRSTLWWLSRIIGPRLTGSSNLEKAQSWAVESLTKIGCDNVHLEKWGVVPVGFDRGARQSARMISPISKQFVFSTNAWTNGTNGPLHGPAIPAPTNQEEFEKIKDKLKGAFIVYPGATYAARGRGNESQELADAVDRAGILGRVWYSSTNQVHTGGSWGKQTYEMHTGLPRFIVRKEDFDDIEKVWKRGQTPEIEFEAEHIWRKGPIPQYNVVAEIRGSEKPDEVVIICGHLDSWDGPGSEGANDNGVGSCTAMEAMRILKAAGARPKRTIRMILWSGEEQGLYGSFGYCRAHKKEMDKISIVLNDDGGSNYQGGYYGPEAYKEPLEKAFAPVVAAFPDMPEVYKVVAGIQKQERGSDHASFWPYKVPAFFTIETGIQNYGKLHHTQYDRFEEAIPKYLVQSATNHAVVAYTIANLPGLLPRTN